MREDEVNKKSDSSVCSLQSDSLSSVTSSSKPNSPRNRGDRRAPKRVAADSKLAGYNPATFDRSNSSKDVATAAKAGTLKRKVSDTGAIIDQRQHWREENKNDEEI